jgi:hypothetical protein
MPRLALVFTAALAAASARRLFRKPSEQRALLLSDLESLSEEKPTPAELRRKAMAEWRTSRVTIHGAVLEPPPGDWVTSFEAAGGVVKSWVRREGKYDTTPWPGPQIGQGDHEKMRDDRVPDDAVHEGT